MQNSQKAEINIEQLHYYIQAVSQVQGHVFHFFYKQDSIRQLQSTWITFRHS